jgi:hypothetical protein
MTVVDARREQLIEMLNRRRRRLRLLLVCLATALGCGLVAGIVGPQILIGGVADLGPAADIAATVPVTATAAKAPPVLLLSEQLKLDPRESQANTLRWAGLSEADRRALLDKYWRLADMDAAERQRIVHQYARFRELPEKRQGFLKTRALELKQFVGTLSPQDQAVLESMSDAQRAERLLQLWQARYGKW